MLAGFAPDGKSKAQSFPQPQAQLLSSVVLRIVSKWAVQPQARVLWETGGFSAGRENSGPAEASRLTLQRKVLD